MLLSVTLASVFETSDGWALDIVAIYKIEVSRMFSGANRSNTFNVWGELNWNCSNSLFDCSTTVSSASVDGLLMGSLGPSVKIVGVPTGLIGESGGARSPRRLPY